MENCCITIVGKDSQALTSKGSINLPLISNELAIDTLRENLSVFIAKIGSSLNGLSSKINGYSLDEIEMNIEVSANGSISLIGSIEAGAKGGITLKFKRCP